MINCDKVLNMFKMDVKKISLAEETILELDATPAFRRWISKAKSGNFRILIEKVDRKTKKGSVLAPNQVSDGSTKATIVPKGFFENVHLKVYSQDHRPHERIKRSPLRKKVTIKTTHTFQIDEATRIGQISEIQIMII